MSDDEVRLFYEAVAKDPLEGLTPDELQTSFSRVSAPFDAYALEVLGRVGDELITPAHGSLARAFQSLDPAGVGEVSAKSFLDECLRLGDWNLTDAQLQRLWEV